MSGDAQPRKRKNKGKKKDLVAQRPDDFLKERSGFRKTGLSTDDREEDIFATLKNSTDEVIHVQKEIGFGGNAITKLVFFCLLATIGVMVGIIFLEFRGSTDDETSSAVDSPWSITLGSFVDQDAHSHAHEEHLEDDHDEHEDLEHDEHTEDLHVKEETSSGIFSWLGFGGSEVANELQDDQIESEGQGFSLLSFLPFVNNREDSNLEEKEEHDGGSWFGFGWNEKNEAVDEIEQETEDEADHEENNIEEEEEELDEEARLDNGSEEEEEEQYEEDIEEEDEEQYEEEKKEKDDEEEEIGQTEEEEEEEDEQTEEEEENEQVQEEEEDLESEEFNRSDVLLKQDSDEEGELDYLPDLEKEEEEEEEDTLSKKEQMTKDVSDEDELEEDNNQSEEVERENENFAERKDAEEKDENDLGLEDDQEEGEEEHASKEKPQKDKSEEELFPEALEALRREAEELTAKEVTDQEIVENIAEQETDDDSGSESVPDETETEGTGDDAVDPLAATTELKEELREEPVVATPATKIESPPPPPPPPPKTEPFFPPVIPSNSAAEEEAEESPVEDEEEREDEEVEAEGEDEEEESDDLEIDKDKFRELIAKYGQDTPESSEMEQSDDDIQKVDYSGGEESPAEEEEDGSPPEVVTEDEQVPSEDELKEWTGVKKADISKITRLESESEGEVEEEEEEEGESEDEPPPPPQPTPRQRGGPKDVEDYHNAAITNDEDWLIREELDRADEEFNYEKARTLYRALLAKNPNSPRARYGFARTYDKQAELERSNEILNIAITGYHDALSAPHVPDVLFIKIASRLINRLRFRGLHLKAVDVHNQLIEKFNSTPEYRTDLAITYLMINRLESARTVLKEVLSLWSEDPTALAHYGLVLKLQGNIHGCVKYFEKGLAMDFTTTKDARLYFHFGDALSRVGREADAIKVAVSEVLI